MAKKSITDEDQKALNLLSKKVKKTILDELGYSSLDAFALEHHDHISKKTLYGICEASRDMQLSTLLGLARALNMDISDLVDGMK